MSTLIGQSLAQGDKEVTVTITASGDYENSPEEAVHHALQQAYERGLVSSWSEPLDPCLIAAAPDLLEAALAQEELASLRMPGDPTSNIVKVREMRRAAIAKAGAAGMSEKSIQNSDTRTGAA